MADLYVFGDSLSDNGNLFDATGNLFPPPPYFDGRLSNGLLAVEYLDTQLPNYEITDNSNLAFSGATTGNSNSLDDDLNADLPGLRDQIDAFTASVGTGDADPTDLYLVWAGPNNFLDPLRDEAAIDPVALIRQGALDLREAATRLYDLGARNLVLPNMVNLGRLPGTRQVSADATAVSRAFNAALALELDNLSFDVTQVDVFATGEAVAANPSSYGFTNITDPAFQPPSLPVSNADEYFFWDTFHPTTRGHEVLGNAIYQTITGEIPPLSFNQVRGTNRGETLRGTGRRDNVDGFGGNDILRGRGQGDRLEGWNGSDQIFGDQGNDILSGGAGIDFVFGGENNDIAFGGNDNDRILGQAGADILIGDRGNDYIRGGLGNDYLLGGEGDDTLLGEDNNDILNGGVGNDSLSGGAGGDRLDGGAGADVLRGGLGADRFVARPDGGKDIIRDFIQGQDRLDVSNFGFDTFDELIDEVTLVGTTIAFNTTDSVRLLGVSATSLTAADFIFAPTG
ncbi:MULTISPECIES: SGNH/GDSL hydrolase family protein [unclassified Leptolyngbya]|uniref:SGNH/GDSL hydrolase family protein n=1 Tax=unclassified Leptolyngbya TaxID=2650499 RepID=UPI0016830F68|nr:MULTISPECIES: SGNH/GDSL hydrolase family protein [unclassified Leptolyngbya]MBD1913520.1 calcium-binding protein [Leptolyngbya sp. FACHB-8]MBD2153258.1 calcium-binding protein [Leptolyngbya sp. FACHB-16]